MTNIISRRGFVQGAALSAGAVALIRAGLTPTPATVEGISGTVDSTTSAPVLARRAMSAIDVTKSPRENKSVARRTRLLTGK